MRSGKRPGFRAIGAILAVAALVLFGRPTPALFWPGLGLSLSGALLRLWACGHLEKNKVLAMGGPYAHLQHPLYLGTLLGLLGLLLALSGPRPPGLGVALAGFPLFLGFFFGYYLPRKRRVEGERLERKFGEAYRRWSREVPELLPRLRPYPGGAGQTFSWNSLARSSELGMFAVFLAGWIVLFLRMRGLGPWNA